VAMRLVLLAPDDGNEYESAQVTPEGGQSRKAKGRHGRTIFQRTFML
jgi:hypothetical protein